jgi:hypothetical protein
MDFYILNAHVDLEMLPDFSTILLSCDTVFGHYVHFSFIFLFCLIYSKIPIYPSLFLYHFVLLCVGLHDFYLHFLNNSFLFNFDCR